MTKDSSTSSEKCIPPATEPVRPPVESLLPVSQGPKRSKSGWCGSATSENSSGSGWGS